MKTYAVLNLIRDNVIYIGPSTDKTARMLGKHCIYGWGQTPELARADVLRRAREFDREVK